MKLYGLDPNGSDPSVLNMSEGDYIDNTINGLLNVLVLINPYLSAPDVEIMRLEAGVYEIKFLIHVHQSKGDIQ
jgi:hypothetical protein